MSSAGPDAPPPGAPARESLWNRARTRVDEAVRAGRRRSAALDHLARAGGRYRRTQGDLLAAGVTYFAFLGLVPVLLLVASVIGLVLSADALLQQELFGEQLVDQLTGAIDSAGVVGLIGLGGFLYAGLRTMDKLRIGMEQIWKGRVDEPDVLRDNLQDLLALLALGALGLASLGLTVGLTQATSLVLGFLGLADEPGYGVLTRVLGFALAVAGDIVAFLWLLRVVPSVSHPLRRLLPGALFGAAGFELLKLGGGFYLSLIADSVTASALGGTVGLLVWINLVARFAFFTAAWTATLPAVEAATLPAVAAATRPADGRPAPEPGVHPAPASPDRRSPSTVRLAAGLLSAGALLGIVTTRLLPRLRAPTAPPSADR
jgi:membrane protein